jgi:hypothetical protein
MSDYRCYVYKKFQKTAEEMIECADDILQDWQYQGYTLTVRQLYYQFVAQDLFPDDRKWAWNGKKWVRDPEGTKNAQPNYTWLGGIITDARLAGRISWGAMTDRTRSKNQIEVYNDIRAFWKDAVPKYAVNHWQDQDTYIEVWVEKEALSEVIEKACGPYYTPFVSCKGYMSASAMYEASLRFEDALVKKKHCHIIHLGDHDPSGIDMTRDIGDRLDLLTSQARDCTCISSNLKNGKYYDEGFLCNYCSDWYTNDIARCIVIHRVALNAAQVDEYNPPPNPAKLTDTRAGNYIQRFGDESWELDALPPSVIAKIIRDKIEELIDVDIWEDYLKEEATDIEKLMDLLEKLEV